MSQETNKGGVGVGLELVPSPSRNRELKIPQTMNKFLKGQDTLIGQPKLKDVLSLGEILRNEETADRSLMAESFIFPGSISTAGTCNVRTMSE